LFNLLVYRERFFRAAAAAPFFPNADRTFEGRLAMVRFFLAAAAAFFIFLRAAVRRFSEVIDPIPQPVAISLARDSSSQHYLFFRGSRIFLVVVHLHGRWMYRGFHRELA
jgi:hypothetical protein